MRAVRATVIVIGLVAGMATGVAAQEEATEGTPLTEVTGHIECGPEVRGGSFKATLVPLADGQVSVGQTRGYAWQPTATMSDPRLEGTYYISYDDDLYTGAGATQRVGTGTWRIENEEGAWQGSYTNAILADGTGTKATTILTGEGAYEGLTVLWETGGDWDACTWDVRGLIIEGELPAAPEPFTGE